MSNKQQTRKPISLSIAGLCFFPFSWFHRNKFPCTYTLSGVVVISRLQDKHHLHELGQREKNILRRNQQMN